MLVFAILKNGNVAIDTIKDKIEIYNPAGSLVKSLQHNCGITRDILELPNGNIIIAGRITESSSDLTPKQDKIEIHDPTKTESLVNSWSVNYKTGGIGAIKLLPNNCELAVAGDLGVTPKLRIYDLDGKIKKEFPQLGAATIMAVLANGNIATANCTNDSQIGIYNPSKDPKKDRKENWLTSFSPLVAYVIAMVALPNGNFAAAVAPYPTLSRSLTEVKIYHPATQRCFLHSFAISSYTMTKNDMIALPNGNIAIRGYDVINIYNPKTGTKIEQLPLPSKRQRHTPVIVAKYSMSYTAQAKLASLIANNGISCLFYLESKSQKLKELKQLNNITDINCLILGYLDKPIFNPGTATAEKGTGGGIDAACKNSRVVYNAFVKPKAKLNG